MTRKSSIVSLLACVWLLAGLNCRVRAFYIPGVAPIEYSENDKLQIKVQCTGSGGSGRGLRVRVLYMCE